MTTWTTAPCPNIWGTTDENTKINRQELADKRGLESCEICGRGVRHGHGWLVHVIDGGGSLLAVAEWNRWDAEASSEDEAGDVGHWLLGPECGKIVPAPFREANPAVT